MGLFYAMVPVFGTSKKLSAQTNCNKRTLFPSAVPCGMLFSRQWLLELGAEVGEDEEEEVEQDDGDEREDDEEGQKKKKKEHIYKSIRE